MSALTVFGDDANICVTYRATLRFKHLVIGGIPSDPDVTRAWIRSRMELDDASFEELVDKTIQERGVITPTEAIDTVVKSELVSSVNGFKRDATGVPCLEGRCVKAALKEWANSAFPGTDWPGKSTNPRTKPLKKGLMRYLSEAVTVPEILIPLQDAESNIEIEERIKHVMTPQGPRSSINKVETLLRPTVTFTVRTRDDFIPTNAWGRIWATGEMIGLGSDRGRSDGQFSLEEWTQL